MFKLARHEMHVNYQARYSTMRYSDSLRLQIQKYLSMSIMDIYYMCACVSQHKRHQIGDGDHYCPLHHQDHIHLYSALSWHIKKKNLSHRDFSLPSWNQAVFSHLFPANSLCWQSASVSAYDISACVRVICYINWSGLSLQLCPWRARARHGENKKKRRGGEKEKESRSNSCVLGFICFLWWYKFFCDMHLLTFTNAQTQAYSFHALLSTGPFLSLYEQLFAIRMWGNSFFCLYVNLTK